MAARLCFVGAGAMGSAAIRGLLNNNVYAKNEIAVCDISQAIRESIELELGVFTTNRLEEAVQGSDTLFIAIKPQDLAPMMESMRSQIQPNQLIISIVAGARLKILCEGLGTDRVVRAMPNTPAQIGRGVTLWTAAAGVDGDGRTRIIRILQSLGTQVFAKEEGYLDMATAVSASGPAYILLVLEAWIDAAVSIGLPRDLATRLVVETIQGTMGLVEESNSHPAALRSDVTSPGGTTAAALDRLEGGGLRSTFASAIHAAYRRSQDLGHG